MPPACKPWINALDAQECTYCDHMKMFVRRGNLKCHLQISDQCHPLTPASHRQCHPPRQWLHSPLQMSPTGTPEPYRSILAHAVDEIPVETDSKNHGLYRCIPPTHSTAHESDTEEAGSWEPLIDTEYPEIRNIPQLGGPSVTIPITVSSNIISITRGNPFIVPKTSNRPSDSLNPTIPSQKFIVTSMNVDARFLSTFPTPLDGRCTIKYTRRITSCLNAEMPPSPLRTVGGVSTRCDTQLNMGGTSYTNAHRTPTWSIDPPEP